MRQRVFCDDRLMQQTFERVALIGTNSLTAEAYVIRIKERQPPAVGVFLRVRIEFAQIGIQFSFSAAREAVYFTHQSSPQSLNPINIVG